MQTELRILNGLHRGGILPLDESTLLIGCHEDADVVLVDPGMFDHHANLQQTDNGWMLTADAGPIFGTEHTSSQSLLDLQIGDFFRLGETWLVISDGAAPWQALPVVVADDASLVSADLDIASVLPESAPEVQIDPASAPFDEAESESTLSQDTANQADTVSTANNEPPSPAKFARRFKLPRWRKWMLAPASLFVMLSAVAAYAFTTKPSLPTLTRSEIPSEWRTDKLSRSLSSNDKTDTPIRQESETTRTKPIAVTAPAPATPPTPQALQSAFRKRMKDADLLQRFDLDLNESAWSMRAHLDDEEGARFERILKAFVIEHKITFPISAKVGSAESMLPFQIRQIVTGANAGIVTGDGDRVYVGDELLGVKLVAVVDNHLTFMGKRKIEVIW